MKKYRKFLMVTAFVMLLPLTSYAKNVRLWIDGNYVTGDVAPQIVNDRTVVPLRMISESLGLTPVWNEPEQSVTIEAQNISVVFKINDMNYVLNGETKQMDVAPQIISDRTFVPLRVIAEVFGKNVDWDQKNETAIVGEGYVPPAETQVSFEKATVKNVVDGDTIVVDVDGAEKKVRLVGIDAPEMSTPNGNTSKKFTEDAILNKTVYLEKDVSEVDKYDRLLRYIWLISPSGIEINENSIRENMLNGKMVASGMAASKTYAPDTKYQNILDKIQTDAINNKLGMWAPAPTGAVVSTHKVEGWGLQFGTFVPENRTKIERKQNGKTYFADTTQGYIKGNASSKKYHLPGMQGYDKISVVNVCFFKTEEEAIARGFV
ncbi:MAG: stalk domain-containing protein, partial [Ezakiella sp.]